MSNYIQMCNEGVITYKSPNINADIAYSGCKDAPGVSHYSWQTSENSFRDI